MGATIVRRVGGQNDEAGDDGENDDRLDVGVVAEEEAIDVFHIG